MLRGQSLRLRNGGQRSETSERVESKLTQETKSPKPSGSKGKSASLSLQVACAAPELAPSSTGMPSTTSASIRRPREIFSLSATRAYTLRTNFLWNAAGSGIFAASQWGIIVVFAKLGSAAVVGQLVYGLALTTPLFVIAGLALRSIQATDAGNRHTLGQYLGLRALTTVAAIIFP